MALRRLETNKRIREEVKIRFKTEVDDAVAVAGNVGVAALRGTADKFNADPSNAAAETIPATADAVVKGGT
jgi:hypothetical protein